MSPAKADGDDEHVDVVMVTIGQLNPREGTKLLDEGLLDALNELGVGGHRHLLVVEDERDDGLGVFRETLSLGAVAQLWRVS
ncbi:MAG: hypothetical protein IPN01_05830 [Deltaproteobacteria bacterium]|nr:hypothetical protein [Deltaproteobacteria bacterium]